MRQEQVFKALADPSRRHVLRLLQAGAMTAGDLAGNFDFTAASMSHHLSLLKSADLVRTERRGQNIVYSLNTSVLEDVSRFVMDLLGSGLGEKQ
jgi:ArsR family transcriptional regulator